MIQRFIASLSALSFLLNPLSAYAVMIPSGEEVNIPTLLSASDYGITEPAQELPAERTLRTATFDLGNGKRAQVSVGEDLFTHHPVFKDQIVFAKTQGLEKDGEFVFNYLPQDTRVSFDLTKPSYTLSKSEHSFTISFATNSSIQGTILNDHQISYPLSENATLVWTVEGTNVKKEIHVKNTGTNPTFEFSIDSSLTKSLENNSIILSDGSKQIFQTEKPYLLTTNNLSAGALAQVGYPLLNSVSLIENSSGNFEYAYDESTLPEEYILDPSAGPNSGTAFANINTIGGAAWSNVSNINAADDSYADYDWESIEVLPSENTGCTTNEECASGRCEFGGICSATYTLSAASNYLKATGFNFSIPSGSTIQGVKVTWEIGYGGAGWDYNASRLVVDGNIESTNRSGTVIDTHFSDLYGDQVIDFGGNSDLWGTTLNVAKINSSDFGTAISLKGYLADIYSSGNATVFADHVGMTVYYTPRNCRFPQECVHFENTTHRYGCVDTDFCAPCTADSECASGSCDEGTGECQGSDSGASCTENSQCLTGRCTTFAGNTFCDFGDGHCGSLDLPSGIGLMRQSNNTIVAFNALTTGVPTPLWIVDTNNSNAKIAAFTITKDNSYGACTQNMILQTDTSGYRSILHDPDNSFSFNVDNRKYALLVPKSASHDRVRICSGKSTIGCTSANSWSFLANDAGSIVSTNGGFSTTGITVSVAGGYWVITGLTGTSGQGESSGGGGDGGGGGDVPEFSTYALLMLLGGCYMLIRKGDDVSV